MKLYQLTDEHRAKIPMWRDKWIANAMSTAAMTEADREICRDAVERLYLAADLQPPPQHRIVFVPSPFVAHFAAGFAAWIWHKTSGATLNATLAATAAATADATLNATLNATADATHGATLAATKWYFVNGDMKDCARALGVGRIGLGCATEAYKLYQGGNFWSAYDSFLSFFRYIAQLPIDYSKWDAWETLSLHSSWRIVHRDFCIISDRPEILLVDQQNRPHCETGPFCRWRDGSALYAVHGVRVPKWIIDHPERITVDAIQAESNSEVQRVMIERFGWERYAAESGADVLDHDERWGTLYGRGSAALFVRVINGSPEPDGRFRHYILPVAPSCEPLPDPEDPDGRLGEPQTLTALNAVASTYGMRGKEYAHLKLRT